MRAMAAENLLNVNIGFVGAGNMAKAIGGGLIKNGTVSKNQIHVTAPSDRNFQWWNDIGALWLKDAREIIANCQIIFLAMKPQIFSDFVKGLGNVAAKTSTGNLDKASVHPKLWVSILAGTTLETLESQLRSVYPAPAIIRIMPNTPMTVGEGCSVFCGNSAVSSEDRERVTTILSSLGKTFEVKEELIDAVTSIIGNGPAYLFVIIEAMADAGVKLGVPRAMALELAAQTMAGAAQMVLQTSRHPGVLKDEVCSPGGSTIAGLHVLEQRGIRAGIMDTLETAARKNKELGLLSSNR